MAGLEERQMCRKLYGQIISGCTPALFGDSKIYVKHFSDNDFSLLEGEFENLLEEAEKKGLYSEQETLDNLIKGGHWSEEEEEQVKDIKSSLQDTAQTRTRLLSDPNSSEVQLKGLEQFKNQLGDQLYALDKAKKELIGTTSNTYAQRKNNERIIFHSLFRDSNLETNFYSEEDFDDLAQEELLEAITIYNRSMNFFTEEWIKKIAVMPSFLNSFFLCNDDPRIFYGKCVINLTIYQTDLFSKGRYFKSILNESEAESPPEEFYEEGFQKVVNWYDAQFGIIQGRRAAEASKAKGGGRAAPPTSPRQGIRRKVHR